MNFDPTVSFSSIVEITAMLLGLAIVWGSINTKLDIHGKQLDNLSTVDKEVAVHEIRITDHDRRLNQNESDIEKLKRDG